MREAQARIDAKEFCEWQAFNEIEPFGDDWRKIGMLCFVMARAQGGNKNCKVEDFMPSVRSNKRRQSAEEQKAILMFFSSLQNK